MVTQVESRLYTYTVYHGIAWCGMAALTVILLILCSLLAGLTLALGGLDTTWLQLRSVTGTPKQRQHALVVIKIKSHSTWMLCSLIISSVACGESLPFVIQSLWHGSQQWAPIILSTFSMALFAEILPQYAIPRQPIAWGYYCSPLVWSCMWLTAIVSYPLAWLLDTVAGRKYGHGLFNNDEMAGVIKYHRLSEQNGGTLGPDAARVMLGALRLDSREIGGDIAVIPANNIEDENDLEKADLVVLQGLIVQWSAVKTIDLDDVVDEAFIAKVTGWSYSRIPVIGNPESHEIKADSSSMAYRWEGKQIFGFLHIKNLVGLEIRDKHNSAAKLSVRDLHLYSLPIIHEDMAVYDLLNIFQLGMSRMALIVPKQLKISQGGVERLPKQENKFQAPRWTALESSNSHTTPLVAIVDGPAVLAVQSHVENTVRAKQDLGGIISPKPIGIVTFEDIVDAILQKTSREERDFFGRGNIPPPTKVRKPADCMKFTCNYSQKDQGVSIFPQKVVPYRPSVAGTVRRRRRNISTRMPLTSKECAMDGIDERSMDDTTVQSTKLCKVRNKHEESCHTQNRRSSSLGGNASPKKIVLARSSSLSKAESLTSRRAIAAVLPDGSTSFSRHVGAAPRLPQLHRVTPFSRQNYSSYERAIEDDIQNGDIVYSMPPVSSESAPSSRSDAPSNITGPGVDLDIDMKYPRVPENTTAHCDVPEAVSVFSWCPGGFVDVDEWNAQLSYLPALEAGSTKGPQSFETSPDAAREEVTTKPQPCRDFPPELLEPRCIRKENHVPNHPASTVPRISGLFIALSGMHGDMPQPREESFHDDRALLPSQRRSINNSANMTVSGTRSSSFWF